MTEQLLISVLKPAPAHKHHRRHTALTRRTLGQHYRSGKRYAGLAVFKSGVYRSIWVRRLRRLRPARNLQRPLAHLKRKFVATLAELALKTAVGEPAAKIRAYRRARKRHRIFRYEVNRHTYAFSSLIGRIERALGHTVGILRYIELQGKPRRPDRNLPSVRTLGKQLRRQRWRPHKQRQKSNNKSIFPSHNALNIFLSGTNIVISRAQTKLCREYLRRPAKDSDNGWLIYFNSFYKKKANFFVFLPRS